MGNGLKHSKQSFGKIVPFRELFFLFNREPSSSEGITQYIFEVKHPSLHLSVLSCEATLRHFNIVALPVSRVLVRVGEN